MVVCKGDGYFDVCVMVLYGYGEELIFGKKM